MRDIGRLERDDRLARRERVLDLFAQVKRHTTRRRCRGEGASQRWAAASHCELLLQCRACSPSCRAEQQHHPVALVVAGRTDCEPAESQAEAGSPTRVGLIAEREQAGSSSALARVTRPDSRSALLVLHRRSGMSAQHGRRGGAGTGESPPHSEPLEAARRKHAKGGAARRASCLSVDALRD